MEKEKLSKPRTKTKPKSEKVKSFLAVRDYIAVILDKKAGEIETDIANKLKTIDQKKLQNYYAGKSSLTYKNAKQIVDLFIDKDHDDEQRCKKYDAIKADKAGVLRKLLFHFLKSHSKNDYDDEIESFLSKYFHEQEESSSDEPQSKEKKEMIQQHIADRIREAIRKKKFVFFSGKGGSGKKHIAETVVSEYSDKSDFKFCLDYENDEMTYTNFLNKLLIESGSSIKSQNMSLNKMERKAAQNLLHKRVIIIINGFDRFKDDEARINLINFFNLYLSEDDIVIITSTEAKEKYDFIDDSFREVKEYNYEYEEWVRLSATFDEYKMIHDAKMICKDLDKLAYEKGFKNPSLMIEYLFTFAKQIMLDDLTPSDMVSNKYLFWKILSDLDDDCLGVLVTLSLFSKEVSKQKLGEISGLDKTGKLFETLGTLRSKKLIKRRTLQNNLQLYSLPNKLRAAVEEEKIRNPQKYAEIYNNWIEHYKEIVSSSEDDLQMEMEDFGLVLDYCDSNGKEDVFSFLIGSIMD